MISIKQLAPLAAAALLAAAATAVAHVEVSAVAGGAPGEIVVSVPGESRAADTTSVAVRLPANVLQAKVPAIAGWTRSEETAPLDPPLQIGGAVVATRVSTVTWTGGHIPRGTTVDFPLRVAVAEGTPRTGLAFPAVQRYSDGSVVRWIGGPTSDAPAGVLATALPTVAAVAVPTTSPTTSTPTTTGSTTATTSPAPRKNGGNPVGLVFALVGAAIAIGGVAAIIRARRAKR